MCDQSHPIRQKFFKNIGEIDREVWWHSPYPLHSSMPETIIGGALIRVGQYRISLIELFEALLGFGRVADIRVVLARQLAEG